MPGLQPLQGLGPEKPLLWLSRLLPRIRTRRPNFDGVHAKSLIVFTKGSNPTFSYYLAERLRRLQHRVQITIHDIRDHDMQAIDPDGAFVIICRYLHPPQVNWIKSHAGLLAGVGLLIDDDVSNLVMNSDAGLRYRGRLVKSHLWPVSRISGQLDIIWASTPALAEILAINGSCTAVLSPMPGLDCLVKQAAPITEGPLVVSFQATSIHIAEHVFLKPIILDVLSRHRDVTFDVIADEKNSGIWRDVGILQDQIHIRSTLAWPDFLQANIQNQVDIALVPLMESPTNRVRSDTKRIDVVRMGAAAVFSDVEAYSRRRMDGEMLIRNDMETWISAIEMLIASPERRAVVRQATIEAVIEMTKETGSIPGILGFGA